MHGIYQTKPLLHTALAHQILHRFRDVHEPPTIWDFKPKMFGQTFHRIVYALTTGDQQDGKVDELSSHLWRILRVVAC